MLAKAFDITTNEHPRTAWAACVKLATELRKVALEEFRAGDWEMRLFSPFSGSRPIATCRV